MLKLEGVTKTFGFTEAVKELSFELKKGDIMGLLGPNGAGKTTTMRMITSYYLPTSGKITVNGLDTTQNTQETQRHIGYLPENNPLYMDMISIDYLMMSAKLNNVQLTLKEIKKTAEVVDIEDKLTTPINQLSKGFKQRLGLAAALIHNPDLLILDEPSEGLDPNQRIKLHKLIKNLSKHKAILISTHVMQEVKAMCNKVVIINEGKLVAEGSPESLSESAKIRVELEGDDIRQELEKILQSNEKIKISDKSGVKVVELMTDRDLSKEISRLIAENKWIIHGMAKEDSLEGIFQRLV